MFDVEMCVYVYVLLAIVYVRLGIVLAKKFVCLVIVAVAIHFAIKQVDFDQRQQLPQKQQ